MKRRFLWALAIVLGLALIAVWWVNRDAVLTTAPTATAPPGTAADPAYPIPDPAPAPVEALDGQGSGQPQAAPPPPPNTEPDVDEPEPLPPIPELDTSDVQFRSEIDGAQPQGVSSRLLDLLVSADLIRRIVVTVENLDADPVAPRFNAVSPPAGAFAVVPLSAEPTAAPQFVTAAANAERYQPYLSAWNQSDPRRLANLYIRYYPLFQQAYADLGYPDRYFNDRLVGVIDHLLATPLPESRLKLRQPKVMYAYASEAIEDRSWGQKALIRISQSGSDGRADVRRALDKLQAFRSYVVGTQALSNGAADTAGE